MATFRDMQRAMMQNSAYPAEFSSSLAAGMNAIAQGGMQAQQSADAAIRASMEQDRARNIALSKQIASLGSTSGVPSEAITQGIRDGSIPDPSINNTFVPSNSSPTPGNASNVGSNTLISLLNKYEGAGDYDTLFGHSQRDGKPFANTRISQMSVGDAIKFSDPSGPYAQWVKGQVGRVATPMGAGQIVGTTLRNSVNQLGIDPNTRFDANTQNMIINHLAKQRINSANSLQGAIQGLRSEWEGFQRVPNQTLAQVIRELGGRW